MVSAPPLSLDDVIKQIAVAQTQQALADLWDACHPRGLWTAEVHTHAQARLQELRQVSDVADQPRCKMCARPARWNDAQGVWSMYCAGKACSNRSRICQHCDAGFSMGVDGAGNKYCSPTCRADGPRPRALRDHCAWCGQARSGNRYHHRSRIWPYVCDECLAPIKHLVPRLTDHRVPPTLARRLIENPGCDVCGVDIVAKTMHSSNGQYGSLLVVDHDHSCCPSKRSCGECVRGFLCVRCNTAAGMVLDDPRIAQGLSEYLARAHA